jgi:hypothetical protein
MRGALIGAATVALTAIALAGCGLNEQAPDLFLLTRTGLGHKLTLLVNDSGTIRCNGGRPRSLPDPLLLQARDLASSLGGDAQERLRIPPRSNSVYRYVIRLQQGTISFPDTATAGGKYPRLAQAELFAFQASHQACGLS